MGFSQKPKALSYDPKIPLLGIHLKKTKSVIREDICTPIFTAALLVIAKIWKQLKCPSTGEWKKKREHVYTMDYYSAQKPGQNCAMCNNMNGLGEYQAKLNVRPLIYIAFKK